MIMLVPSSSGLFETHSDRQLVFSALQYCEFRRMEGALRLISLASHVNEIHSAEQRRIDLAACMPLL